GGSTADPANFADRSVLEGRLRQRRLHTVFTERDPRQPLRAQLLSRRDERVELAARARAPAGVHETDDPLARLERRSKYLEIRAGKRAPVVRKLHAETQIGLVDTVLRHRLFVRQAAKR